MIRFISILVPIYNVEKYIERCAVSLFEQTYENIEYIFVNDCTPDNSIQVLEAVMERYPSRRECTRIINHDVNRGLAAARNTAVANCTGEFIMHVDSDDYLETNAVELLVKQQSNSNADMVSGMAVMHTTDQDIILPHPHYSTKEEMVLDMLQQTINHSIWKRLIKKSLYDECGVSAKEGVNCGEDCWVMTQLAYYASSFSFVDEVVYHYDCTRDNSYMSYNKASLNRKKIRDDIATLDLIRDFFKDKETIYYDEANHVTIMYLRDWMKKAAAAGEADLFYELVERLKGFDRRYWHLIHWNRGYNRFLSQNLCTYRCIESVKGLYSKIITLNKS